MSTTKLIRHNMASVGPAPVGTRQELIGDLQLLKALLVAKGHEEVAEVAKAPPDEVKDELADLYEVWYALCLVHGREPEAVIRRAGSKAEARGPLLRADEHGKLLGLLHRVPLT